MNQNTTLNRPVLRAHRWKIVNICSAPVLLSLVTFLFHFLLWFVVICVCFPSWTNFPLKVSRRTCRYCFTFYLHYLIITISFIQYVFIDTYVLLELAFFSGVTFKASHYMFMSVIHLHGTLRRPKEISHWNFRSFNKTNFDNSTQCHMNNDYCLFFVDGPLLPFLFLASQKNFEVAASSKHLLKGGWVPVINNNFDSAPTKQVLIDLNWKHDYLLLIKIIKQQIKELKTSPA